MLHIKDLPKSNRPIRVLQFGGGVFLRGFFDWMLQKSNDAGVYNGSAVIVRSRTSGPDPLSEQNFNYTHVARDGARCDITPIDCIAGSVDAMGNYAAFLALAELPTIEVIVSNTTEAGIVYAPCPPPVEGCPAHYPAKLTAWLYRRFCAGLSGVLILPCELIARNGAVLREAVLRHAADWSLGDTFLDWVKACCDFRCTLVDRIVSGKPAADEQINLPFADGMVNTSEYFHLLIIEGREDARLPFARIGLQVKWVESAEAYRTIKVRILNGAHTSMIPYALLCGLETVGDCLNDAQMRTHLSGCLEEILLSLEGDANELRAYADAVLERFSNPHIRHLCRAIALNSVSKFAVRVVPSILAYQEKSGHAPRHLLFALGMLIRFYRLGEPQDDPAVIARFRSESVADLLADAALWGVSLQKYAEEVERYANTPV